MNVAKQRLGYQPEIDGLRAVAIVVTVLFHVGVPGFRGGYGGVDIFFVISGFLITRILLAELERSGKIDFPAFYARRVRRLLPALVTVTLAFLLVAALLPHTADEMTDWAKSAIATAAFGSNVYFWRRQIGYFADPAEWFPLLNMWTLSVEEQFYLIWPALLLTSALVARHFRLASATVIAWLVASLFAVSFVAASWSFMTGFSFLAPFYLMPARGWEFAVGGMIALVEGVSFRRVGVFMKWLPAIGLMAMVSTVVTDLGWAPSVWLANVGAAAVLLGALWTPQSFVIRMLQASPFVLLGKLSYSWYLWHWPLLALVRVNAAGTKDPVRDFLVAGAALGLAALTYRFIENPIRYRKPWPFSAPRQTLAVGGVMSLIVIGFASLCYLHASREGAATIAGFSRPISSRFYWPSPCFLLSTFVGPLPADQCVVGTSAGPKRVLLWGDSHANHFLGTLDEHGRHNGYAAIARVMAGCTHDAATAIPRQPSPTALHRFQCRCRKRDSNAGAQRLERNHYGSKWIWLCSDQNSSGSIPSGAGSYCAAGAPCLVAGKPSKCSRDRSERGTSRSSNSPYSAVGVPDRPVPCASQHRVL